MLSTTLSTLPDESENILRVHIRRLLLGYALTHLTTNYITYSETEVMQILSRSLDFVAEHDPTSITLPVEPFDTLSQILNLKSQTSYEESWAIDDQTRQVLTSLLPNKSRAPPTTRCWELRDEGIVESVFRPCTPVLTRRAVHETPNLGKSTSVRRLKSLRAADLCSLSHLSFSCVPEENITETELPPRERDHLLGIRPALDKETHRAITQLLSQISVAPPNPKTSAQSNMQLPPMALDFLRSDSPLIPDLGFRPMSPPIFPRHIANPTIPGPQKPSDVRTSGLVKPVPLGEEEEDPSEVNMKLVDGWNVLLPSQSDTPTLEEGSLSSQIDELFALTPPGTTSCLANFKLDDHLIPVADMPRKGKKKHSDPIPSTLATFLPPFLPSIPSSSNSEGLLYSGEPQPSASILGEPPSPPKAIQTSFPTPDDHQTGLSELINRLCAPIEDIRPEDWIIKERLSSKDSMMMDVPIVKEPNVHPPSSSCPEIPASIRSLVLPHKTSKLSGQESTESSSVVCLKKVTGIQSLNIELSWRPFNFGTSIPKTEELINVATFLPTEYIEQADVSTAEMLLTELESSSDAQHPVDAKEVWKVGWIETERPRNEFMQRDVVLTRGERRRRYGIPPDDLDDEPPQTDTAETGDETVDGVLYREDAGIRSPSSPNKRRKVDITTQKPISPDDVDARSRPIDDTMEDFVLSFRALTSPSCNVPVSAVASQDVPFWQREGDEAEYYGSVDSSNQLAAYVDAGPWVAENAEYQATPPIQRTLSAYLEENRLTLLPADRVSKSVVPLIQSSKPESPKRAVLSRRQSDRISYREALLNFMNLRGKTVESVVAAPFSSSPPEPAPALPSSVEQPISPPRGPPDDLIDSKTLILPSEWDYPAVTHKYIASLEFIQKTVLVQSLISDCNVELVERELPGNRSVDLILDVDTAILFVSLAPLPVTGPSLAERLAALSWEYDRLIVIFEAFSASSTLRSSKAGTIVPYAFSPAVVKAIRSLKRTSAIMESVVDENGEYTKRPEAVVYFGYAKDVTEEARFARFVGNGLDLENDREWLQDDYHEEEVDLMQVPCINPLAAASILRYMDLGSFVDMPSEERSRIFTRVVGERRVQILDQRIAMRLARIEMEESSSPGPSYSTEV